MFIIIGLPFSARITYPFIEVVDVGDIFNPCPAVFRNLNCRNEVCIGTPNHKLLIGIRVNEQIDCKSYVNPLLSKDCLLMPTVWA